MVVQYLPKAQNDVARCFSYIYPGHDADGINIGDVPSLQTRRLFTPPTIVNAAP